MQDCSSNSVANALELLQSCTKPSIWRLGDPILYARDMISKASLRWDCLVKGPLSYLMMVYGILEPIRPYHYSGVIMGAIASQITSLTIVYWTVYSDADQRKYQSSASLAFVRGIHRGPGTSPRKGPVTFPFDDVIQMTFVTAMVTRLWALCHLNHIAQHIYI